MITSQEFKRRCERVEEDRLVAFPARSQSDVGVSPAVLSFLTKASLPEDANRMHEASKTATPFKAPTGIRERSSLPWFR